MSDLNVSLIIKAINQATGPVRDLTRVIKRDIDSIKEPTRNLSKAMSNFTGHTKRNLLVVTALMTGAAFGFKRLFIDTAAEFEKYQMMLLSLEGSNDKAQASMKWIQDFAATVPLEMNDVTQAFIKLRNFGLDPMDGTMQALIDQNAKLGGSSETLESMIQSLGKAWAKQKLGSEEAMQLIEKGVPVWDLLAKATGRSAEEIQQLAEKGKLGRGAIKILIDEIGKNSAGAAANQAKTWNGMLTMLSSMWTRFVNMIMSNGVFDFLKSSLQEILDTVNALAQSGKLEQIAKEIAVNLIDVLKLLWELFKDLVSIGRVVGGMLMFLRDLFGSWKPVILGIVLLLTHGMVFALGKLTVAMVRFGFAMLATPVGQFMALLAIIIGAAGMIMGAWNPIQKFFPELWDGIVEVVGGSIAKIIELIKFAFEYSPLGMLIKGIGKLKDFMSSPAATTQPVPTVGGGAAVNAQQVNGLIRVQIDSEGRPRVAQMDSAGVDMEASTGMSFARP